MKDLEKSLAAQKALLQQQQELEAESAEMQDFLQEEKATLADALKEAETEVVYSWYIDTKRTRKRPTNTLV